MKKLTPLIIGFVLFTLYEVIDFNHRNLELKRVKAESYRIGKEHAFLEAGTALNRTLDMSNRDKKIYNEIIQQFIEQDVKELRKYSEN